MVKRPIQGSPISLGVVLTSLLLMGLHIGRVQGIHALMSHMFDVSLGIVQFLTDVLQWLLWVYGVKMVMVRV